MRLPIPDELWTAFLDHLKGCPIGEAQCSECQRLLHAWGDADQAQARAQMERDIAEGCWGPATDWPHDDRLPDLGERTT